MEIDDYIKKDIGEIFHELDSSIDGLSSTEAYKRFEFYGKNELKLKIISPFKIFIKQFKSPLIILLIVANVISFALGSFSDAITITFILLINSLLGFYQEFKSEESAKELMKLISSKVEVRRDKIEVTLDKEEVTIGDILILKQGDIVPADARVIKANDFSIDASILTGETLPQNKTETLDQATNILKSKNFIFSGSTVAHGYGEAIVIDIGQKTQVGRLAYLTAKTNKTSRYEKNILEFSRLLMEIVLGSLSILFILKLIFPPPDFNVLEFLLFILALSLATVPEALPVITTLTMSAGAKKLSSKSVVVKRLSVLEDLGNVDILCTDKTGTLTENILQVKDYSAEDMNLFLRFSSIIIETPTAKRMKTSHSFDDSIRQFLNKHEFKDNTLEKTKITPFDPILKRRSVEVISKEDNNKYIIYLGATEELISASVSESNKKTELLKKISDLGREGLRSIGVSYLKNSSKSMIFLGYYVFEDPLKKSAIPAIKTAKKLGLAIKILTGDSVEVAQFIGEKVGLINLGEKVYSGEDLEKLSKADFVDVIINHNIFARVNPEQKYQIIQELQKKYTVAYQGDGINDAPSLKLADVAIAVDSATDVAKDAADVILLHNDLKAVIEGIKDGREVFININKYIKHTMVGNFGTFFVLSIAELFLKNIPLLPIQLLLSNLITDLPLIFISTDRIDNKELKKPEEFSVGGMFTLSIALGSIVSFFSLIFIFINQNLDKDSYQTALFIFFNIVGLVIIFSVRVKGWFFKGKAPSKLLFYSAMIVIIASMIIPYTELSNVFHLKSLGVSVLIEIVVMSLLYFLTLDFFKVRYENFLDEVLNKSKTKIKVP